MQANTVLGVRADMYVTGQPSSKARPSVHSVACPPQWLPVLLTVASPLLSPPTLEIVGGHASTTCAPASYCKNLNTPSSTWSTLLYSTGPSGNGFLLNLTQPNDNVGGHGVRLAVTGCTHKVWAGSVDIDLGVNCTLAAGNGFGCGAGSCYDASSSVTCSGGRLADPVTLSVDSYPFGRGYTSLSMCEGARHVGLQGQGTCVKIDFLDDADNVSNNLRISCIPPPYVFTTKASLQTAVQEYNTNPAAAAAEYGLIADWDVSAVTDMSSLLKHLKDFNADISSWDTSGVKSMYLMFYGASAFNQPLSFDTSSVTDMGYMFYRASAFNQPLSFDTSSVTTMRWMFKARSSPCPAPRSAQSSPALHGPCAAAARRLSRPPRAAPASPATTPAAARRRAATLLLATPREDVRILRLQAAQLAW